MSSFKKVQTEKDIETLNQIVSNEIERSIHEILQIKNHVVLGLCGGRSVGAIYELLSKKESIDWRKVHIFLVDERLVPIESEESNYKLIQNTLINNLLENSLIERENLHPFIFDPKQDDCGTVAYTKEFNELGGKFDIAVLSSGEDGHIGAIYPNHESFHNDSEGFIFMHDSPKPPPNRMSISKNLFLKTHTAILLVIGEQKAKILSKIVDETTEAKECPAVLVKTIPNSFLITNLNID